jgi:hypothetical protein
VLAVEGDWREQERPVGDGDLVVSHEPTISPTSLGVTGVLGGSVHRALIRRQPMK